MKRGNKAKLNSGVGKPRRRELSSTERIDRLELLSHAEALLIQSLSHVLHLGFGGELNWPVMIVRRDGTRVHVLEQAVELVAEHLEQLCHKVETEIIELSDLPARDIHDRYKVVQPRSKEHPRPKEELHPSDKRISTGKRPTEQYRPITGPATHKDYNSDKLK